MAPKKVPKKAVKAQRQQYTQAQWSQIRPLFKHFYVDLDMTLREVMQRLGEEHNFRAT